MVGDLKGHRVWVVAALVSLLSWSPAAEPEPPMASGQVTGLTARHRAGQTLLTWHEVDSPVTRGAIPAPELEQLRRKLASGKQVRYRVYRSEMPIASIAGLTPVADVPPLSCWNTAYYGGHPKRGQMALRYVVEDGAKPVPPGTGIAACNPPRAGSAYYAVTIVVDGTENQSVTAANALQTPIEEVVGQGVPVLQRIERPDRFHYVGHPTLYYYVRWESPPNCAAHGKAYDYLVAVPPKLAHPAPAGISLHCWGGDLNGGYGWWYGAEQGHLLIASNQMPYDWWTGYHERYWEDPPSEETWTRGVVRPYSQIRMLSFLRWVASRWDVNLTRTHVAGNSMGGSGAPMLAIRYPHRIAWTTAWVGVHNPAKTPQFKGSYERVYGKASWNVRFEDGPSVWDYYSDAWYLQAHPGAEIGLICFSNGKNDDGIGWPQAIEFYRALQETKRPHIFVWGQRGHSQRARLPVSLGDRFTPMDLSTDQSQPAFAHCSLDDQPGNGDPEDGDPEGQVNLYLYWDTDSVVDQNDRWEMTVGLVDRAPQDRCTVDITPRRLQHFQLRPGTKVRWTNTSLADGKLAQTGEATIDSLGLVTLPGVTVGKGKNRLAVAE